MTQYNNILYERLSAMQKSVRRGLIEDAGYWFFALAENGYFNAAIKRLSITCHEDISVLDVVSTSFALRALDDASAYFKAGNNSWRIMIANAIIVMCRARKSREGNHLQAVCRGRYLNDKRNGTL